MPTACRLCQALGVEMTYGEAIFIIAACVGIVLVLSAPFLYLSDRHRKKRSAQGERVAPLVPKDGLPALLAYVLVMFFGFAHAYIAPRTWFGQFISTDTGRVVFLVLPALLVAGARVGWLNHLRFRKGTRR